MSGILRCDGCGWYGTETGVRSTAHRMGNAHRNTMLMTEAMRDGFVPVVRWQQMNIVLPFQLPIYERLNALAVALRKHGALEATSLNIARGEYFHKREVIMSMFFVHRTVVESLLLEYPDSTPLAREIRDMLHLTDLVYTHKWPWWAVLGRSQQHSRGTLLPEAYPFGRPPPCPLPGPRGSLSLTLEAP